MKVSGFKSSSHSWKLLKSIFLEHPQPPAFMVIRYSNWLSRFYTLNQIKNTSVYLNNLHNLLNVSSSTWLRIFVLKKSRAMHNVTDTHQFITKYQIRINFSLVFLRNHLTPHFKMKQNTIKTSIPIFSFHEVFSTTPQLSYPLTTCI